MKQDDLNHDKMQDHKLMRDGKVKTLETGKFDGKIHPTSGRATLYQEADGRWKIGPAADGFQDFERAGCARDSGGEGDATGDANFPKGISKIAELGKRKGNEGDQNHEVAANADLNKYRAVVIYSQKSHAILGVAKLGKF
jgi:hypothetical protein